ncbi:RNA-directed DNA polymerase, eukaryota [Tanacetum coccineum]
MLLPSQSGSSGGILCVWDSCVFIKDHVLKSDYFVAIMGTWVPTSTKLLIISVYAPQELTEKRDLWNYLRSLIDRWDGETVIMGDFNEVRYEHESLDYKEIKARSYEKKIKHILQNLSRRRQIYCRGAIRQGRNLFLNEPTLKGDLLELNYLDALGVLSKSMVRWCPLLVDDMSRLKPWEDVISKEFLFNGIDGYGTKKSHGLDGDKILASKKNGGLGVSSLYATNRALLFKWIWRFFSQDSSWWSCFIQAMHGNHGALSSCVTSLRRSSWLDIIREMYDFNSKVQTNFAFTLFERPLWKGFEVEYFIAVAIELLVISLT